MSHKKTVAKTPAPKTSGKPKYVGLARVSSREQESGFSLDTQEQEIRQYVAKQGGELVRFWRIAETATRSVERKTFHELIAFAKAHAHELTGVVFAKLDRACRDYCETVLNLPDMLEWIEAAKSEQVAMEELEAEF